MSLDKETIVIVDDDDIMRQLIRDVLELGGATVEHIRSFADGAEANAFFEEEACTEAIVICDISMPNLGGFELYKKVRALVPGLKFVFVSALNLDRSQQRFLEREGLGLIKKPFTPNEMIAAVQDLSSQQ